MAWLGQAFEHEPDPLRDAQRLLSTLRLRLPTRDERPDMPPFFSDGHLRKKNNIQEKIRAPERRQML